jgi:hypothetical protein
MEETLVQFIKEIKLTAEVSYNEAKEYVFSQLEKTIFVRLQVF